MSRCVNLYGPPEDKDICICLLIWFIYVFIACSGILPRNKFLPGSLVEEKEKNLNDKVLLILSIWIVYSDNTSHQYFSSVS